MDVHCIRCAGVDDVWVSVDMGVWRSLSVDASLLRRRIQSRTGKPVAVLSDGGEEPPAGQMVHLGPPPPPPLGYSYSYPYGGGYAGYGGWPAPGTLQYMPGGGNAFSYDARQYRMMMANDAPPLCYRDDGPSGCCTMQ